MRRWFLVVAPVLLLAAASRLEAGASGSANMPPKIPLCEGLTIVTAISERDGDYESIKRIETATSDQVRLHYSHEFLAPPDPFNDTDKGGVVHVSSYRTILREDLAKSHAYLQQFQPFLQETMKGTTALGASTEMLTELKTKGQTFLISFLTILPTSPGNPLERAVGMLDYRIGGVIQRVEPEPVLIPVIVNDQRVNLPAIHAKGLLTGDAGDFYFLDDPANPIALRFTIGKSHLNVIKISFPHALDAAPPLGSGSLPAPPKLPLSPAPQLEQTLHSARRAEVYGIYFEVGSAAIRKESEPVLEEIAQILTRNPSWKLNVEGHTDSTGGAAYNLILSRRRAASVKETLVKRYHIAEGRLAAVGFGASRPRETNETLEGRARNRRVELVRIGG